MILEIPVGRPWTTASCIKSFYLQSMYPVTSGRTYAIAMFKVRNQWQDLRTYHFNRREGVEGTEGVVLTPMNLKSSSNKLQHCVAVLKGGDVFQQSCTRTAVIAWLGNQCKLGWHGVAPLGGLILIFWHSSKPHEVCLFAQLGFEFRSHVHVIYPSAYKLAGCPPRVAFDQANDMCLLGLMSISPSFKDIGVQWFYVRSVPWASHKRTYRRGLPRGFLNC